MAVHQVPHHTDGSLLQVHITETQDGGDCLDMCFIMMDARGCDFTKLKV